VLRAGASGGSVVGRPRCSRIALTTVRSVMKAITLRRPPQGQASASSRKTRCSSSAHGILASGLGGFEGSASGAVSSGSAGAAGVGADPRSPSGLSTGAAGTISLRHFEAGPNIPWKRTRCARGGGTSVARRRSSSTGSSCSSCVGPAGCYLPLGWSQAVAGSTFTLRRTKRLHFREPVALTRRRNGGAGCLWRVATRAA
jgi:hypothetical protein